MLKNIADPKDTETKTRSPSELSLLKNCWLYLDEKQRKLSYSKVLDIARAGNYPGAHYPALASECAKWGISPIRYKQIEDLYEKSVATPMPFDTQKRFEVGNFVGRFFPREDVRVGFFGEYTDCCQHFNQLGESCAISSMIDSYSALFVIERDSSIVGGSWIWQNIVSEKKVACFDNIETLLPFKNRSEIKEIYKQAANYLAQEEEFRKVTVGGGVTDVHFPGCKEALPPLPLPEDYKGYSDAKINQVILSENKKAPRMIKFKVADHRDIYPLVRLAELHTRH